VPGLPASSWTQLLFNIIVSRLARKFVCNRRPVYLWNALHMFSYFASAPSASSAQSKRLFRSARRMAYTRAMSTVIPDAADGADDVRDVSSPIAVILIVRVPDRPSRTKTISSPSTRRKVCVRRSRPASARGSRAMDAAGDTANSSFAERPRPNSH
jgi:hypothetical protein